MRRRHETEAEPVRRSIYLLPNLLTAFNLLCGFYAVIAGIKGRFVAAAIAILVAAVFDNLDGKVARATNATSRFGVEFDSLADLVSFGVAPGVMIYLWALQPFARIGWLAAFLFVACGALRLARFNVQVGKVDSTFFVGLPIPAAAGITAATVLFFDRMHIVPADHPYLVLILLYCLAFLMVSTVPYYSFKTLHLFGGKNFNALVSAILVLMFIAAQPSIALFLFGVAYLVSGPVVGVVRQVRKKRTGEEDSCLGEEEMDPFSVD